MKRKNQLSRDPAKLRVLCGLHPCQDPANVHVSDPLAVGIEELVRPIGPFPRSPGVFPSNPNKKRK